jgi:hypothetical protein
MDDFQPVTDWEYQRLMQIMKENGSKSFVQRILRPSEFPTLDLGDGNYATHRMAWGQLGDKYVAYPTVLMNENGKLQDYAGDAWNHVQKTGNYITFDSPDEADWFAKSYKGAWGGQMNKPPQ